MNNNETVIRELFVCDCSDPSHQLIIERWDWGDGDPEFEYLAVYIHLVPQSFWRRIKTAFWYRFVD